MFQLHDTTRRQLCKALFVVMALLPTASVVAWCIARRLPSRMEAEAQSLGRQLGLEVRLQGLKYPRPGEVVYEGLQIVDCETSQVLFRCRQLAVVSETPLPNREHRGALALFPSQAEINAEGINRLWKLLERTLEGHYGRLGADLRLVAGDVTIAGAESQTLTDVVASLASEPNATQANLQFRVAGAPAASSATSITVVRNREVSPPAFEVDLNTNGSDLPCNLLGMAMNQWDVFGSHCRFRGRIHARQLQEGWQGEIDSAKLGEIDLDRLVSDHLPHRLTGTADLTIQSARFVQGRLEEASMMFSAGPGTIDRSLIDSAEDHWGLTATAELAKAPEQIRYQELAFVLTLDSKGATVQGCTRIGDQGTILANAKDRLLGEPVRQPRPVASLVQTLASPNDLQVPASRQTVWFLDHLPLPPKVIATTDDRSIQARVRLRQPDRQ